MKAVMITLDQAHYEEIVTNLSSLNIRGFTAWKSVRGRGSKDGEPHYGTHAWPAFNNAILTVVEDDRVKLLLDYLRKVDEESPNLGLRAFVWNIEDGI
ncbi:MAG: PG0541 family transporter-associated protein [Proteiniphilum sp.]